MYFLNKAFEKVLKSEWTCFEALKQRERTMAYVMQRFDTWNAFETGFHSIYIQISKQFESRTAGVVHNRKVVQKRASERLRSQNWFLRTRRRNRLHSTLIGCHRWWSLLTTRLQASDKGLASIAFFGRHFVFEWTLCLFFGSKSVCTDSEVIEREANEKPLICCLYS